ncbi:hypothetical protein [Halosimplex sp. J119]
MDGPCTRRALLAGGCATVVGALSGCPGAPGSDDLAHYVEAFNYAEGTHNVFVRVTNAEGEDLYRQQFRLGPDRAEEDTNPFTGDPATIAVTVDGSEPVERDWPENRCEERGIRSAGGAEVRIGEDGTVEVALSCDTVAADD